jgi:formate hydrogenlyase transcriptional activator
MGIKYEQRPTTAPAKARPDRAERALPEPRAEAGLSAQGRTSQLTRANLQLSQEIDERKRAEGSLQGAYAEVKRWKDRLQAENIYLQQEVARGYNFGEIVGESGAIVQVRARAEQVAALSAAVLVRGEAGTGKRVVARAIHTLGARKDRPMIVVNLAALPANLIECELFGWERGELTGADSRQIGRLELADAGTVLLEEIGELPLELQGRLLRLIQDGELERLGSPRTIKLDVRVIAATTRDLEQEVLAGRFREDLFCRLNIFPITIPPLRQRKEDIALLVAHFLAKYSKHYGHQVATVPDDTLSALEAYGWPGNVRELESVIERALITSRGGVLQISERSEQLRQSEEPAGEQQIKALAELEHDHILLALHRTGWRVEGEHGAAGLLGLNPSTLRARMRKYGILRQYVHGL